MEPVLSLCLIARDSARTLGDCLESIRPWVDEMVVVDTGSIDETPQIAEQLGARVSRFQWCDDFSAARNESLRRACGKWLFWMDSDDTIDAENGRRLRDLARGHHAEHTLGYVVQVVCPGPRVDGANDCTVVDHVKVLKNLPGLAFEGRIHEQVLPAIRRLGGEIGWTDIHVVHSGADQTAEGRKRKQERDLRILLLEHFDRPDHPFTLFNLGMTYADMGNHTSAIDSLNGSIASSGKSDSHLRKAYSLLVNSYVQIGELVDAERVCAQGRNLFPDDPELLFRDAVLAHRDGRLADAEQLYMQLVSYRGERYLASVDPTITGFKARQNLAAVYHDGGQADLAELQWRYVVAQVPEYRTGWRGLLESLFEQRRFHTAELEIERMQSIRGLESTAKLLGGRLKELRGDLAGARTDILAAIQADLNDNAALEALCRLLFLHGEPFEARLALTELSARTPDNPAVFHNLGTVNLRLEEFNAAAQAFEQSLRLRPDSPQTLRELASSLHALGRVDESNAAMTKAEELERRRDNAEVIL